MLASKSKTFVSRAVNLVARGIQARNIFTYPGPKALDQICKVHKLEQETPETISQVWHEFHKYTFDTVGEVMSAQRYKLILERSKKCKMFVLPVDKNLGYVTMVAQFQHPYILITALREFQERGDNAVPWVSVHHFTELSMKKGVVLTRGEVNIEVITKHEAEELVKMLYKFYVIPELYTWVETFNNQPHLFNFDNFIQFMKYIKPPAALLPKKPETSQMKSPRDLEAELGPGTFFNFNF